MLKKNTKTLLLTFIFCNFANESINRYRKMNNQQYFCVILAGGKGKRLWPCSRETQPKQFIDFFGTGRTQLQTTYDRILKLIPQENFFVCTNHEYEPMVREQLPDVPEEHILAEPVNRNTAPSVAWACFRIKHICKDARVIVTPSDQAVMDVEAYVRDLTNAMEFIGNHDNLLTLGVTPSRPEPGYGYIQMGEPVNGDNLFSIKSFTEKPEREFARIFMESGEFLWNTGIFMANVKTMVASFEKIFPAVFRLIDEANLSVEEEHKYVHEHFPVYPNVSMDDGILEQSDNVYVMRCNFGWADMGTWHSVYEALSKGPADNVVIDSEVIMEGCRNNVVKLPKGKVGVFCGLEGFIVAERGNVLMICKKEDSSALVRKFVNEVQMKYGDEFI